MTAKQKRIMARLEQIKEEAAEIAMQTDQIDTAELNDAAGLAEEAAGLGLDLLGEGK